MRALGLPHLSALCALAQTAPLASCGDELVRWRDPDVVIGDAPSARGPTTLVVGFGLGDTFVSLADAPTQSVVDGLQGGTWTMPTLRADTLAAALEVVCTLTTDAGEVLGRTEVTTPTRPAAPGWVEVARLPIPVAHAAPRTFEPIADLEGAAAAFACSVSAAGATAEATYRVVLDVP